MPINTMQGPLASAQEATGYKPQSGRADRLEANIVGETDFDNLASGGDSGGAGPRF